MRQSIETPSIYNARELGGYVNKEGKRIKSGLLIRTGKLTKMSDEDCERLANVYHVKKVFDFRASDERKREADREIPGAKNYWISILDEGKLNASKQLEEMDRFETFLFFIRSGFLKNMYVDIVLSPHSQKGYHEFLKEVISCEEGAVIWHCSAGKDRTGLAALFLLTILDFDWDVIYEDYLLTNEYTKDLIEVRTKEFLDYGVSEEYIKEIRCIEGVDLEFFQMGIDAIEQHYGSFREYIVNQLGISEEEIQLLKSRYLY